MVSVPEQRAYVYRNGIRIGASTVSTGKPGHETPTGVFSVLEKDQQHVSSTYQGAALPYMERLTWDGIALHTGKLPGYPASHGCVRLPLEFSKRLYSVTHSGTHAAIADTHSAPTDIVHPGIAAPVDPSASGKALNAKRRTCFLWEPHKAPQGPVSILISGSDRRMMSTATVFSLPSPKCKFVIISNRFALVCSLRWKASPMNPVPSRRTGLNGAGWR